MAADGNEPNRLAISIENIQFPSDRLTFGQLRRVFPADFSDGALKSQRNTRFLDDVFPMLQLEKEIAAMAFARAAGVSPPKTRFPYLDDEGELIEDLAMFYTKLGIASGEKHAAELIRGITSQAVAQASPGRDR